jgi:diguanylate cyclase (GGDEF)-like protein
MRDNAYFSADDVRLLETLAAHAAVAIENSRLVDRLRFDAEHDTLTGLPNRRRMIAALHEAVRISASNDVVAVIVFDVDGMRDVNDSLGHAAGDRLLIEFARRLRALSPAKALVARVGGDTFGVTLRIESADEAVHFARDVRAALNQPMQIGSLSLDLGSAVGVSVHPDHGSDPATLLQQADVATQAAKVRPEAVQLFHASLESRSVRRLGLAADLRRALDVGDLEMLFQPKVALAGRTLVGVECLPRWQHPVHGEVAPDDFLAVAEHTGQLGRLTEFVLREVLHRARAWVAAGQPMPVSVNVSPRMLADPTFPDRVQTLLDEHDIPTGMLTLEISADGGELETDRQSPGLHRLGALGVRLAVDGFGTGHSFAYLRQLPVNEVKIDRSFVLGMATDPGDRAIVRAIVDLSRHLHLVVVAEGVESERTVNLLAEMGCDVGQGFLFSRPLPYDRLVAWLAAQTELLTGEPEHDSPGHAPGDRSSLPAEVRRLRAVQ